MHSANPSPSIVVERGAVRERRDSAALLGRGADLNWVSTWDGLSPLDAARRSEQDGLDPTELVAWLLARGAKAASELG